MIGYLRPSLLREAVTYKKDIQKQYPRTPKRRGGARVASTRLTPNQVRWVRANCRKNGGEMSYRQMAEELNIGVSTVRSIVCGITWKEIV